ncbi:CBS domain-containing protein [Halomarina oriensis]|uniref:CBS domain-containing protein n=1 Tax=Halomarina oriensis TaxID=671145 RepID=A0A6B0GMP8_9EURY|nr:CBS domain-containing protein [Halomarina oriensis]MWG34759.1 CBS domain-containing protein [Halomarina oriensis]
MNVADAMTPGDEVVSVSLPGNRDDALEYLRTGEFSSVAVVKPNEDGEVFRGLVSREGLINNPDEDQLALLVEDGPTIGSDASLEELAAVMREHDARRVPVVDGDTLEGIVTITDVVRAIAEGNADGDSEVGVLATREVNCVYAETPLAVVERELSHADVPYGIVVGEDDEGDVDIVGIVTEADLIEVAKVVEGEGETGDSIADEDDDWKWEGIKAVGNRYVPTRDVEFPAGTAREFMSDELVTVSRTKTAQHAAREMLRHDIEQIPLVSGNDLVGIVQDMDLLKAL